MERSGWITLAVGAVLVLLGLLWAPRLPPTVTPLTGIPFLLAGIGLFISVTFSAEGLGRLPRVPTQIVGVCAAAVGLLWLLKQPGALAGPQARALAAVSDACREAELRVERHLIERLALVPDSPALQPVLVRCLEQTRAAFEDPEGTHRSWRQLRDHLQTRMPDDPVFDLPYRPRQHPVIHAIEL